MFGRIGFRGYTVNDLVEKGEGALTIGSKHISKNNRLDLADPEYLSLEKYEESPEIKIYNNDVLLVKTGSTLGKISIIENLEEPATINPQIVVFKNISINNKFFYYYLSSNFFQKQINRIKTATAIPTFTQKELMKLPVKYPNFEEQMKITEFLILIDKKIELLEEKYEYYQNFKKYLMQQIFAQKLRLIGLLYLKERIFNCSKFND